MPVTGPVVAQLVNGDTGACWTASFTAATNKRGTYAALVK